MDVTDQEQETRRNHLRNFVRQNGGLAAVTRKFGLTPSQASFISQLMGGYSFGSRAARNLEARLKMPSRWLEWQQSEAEQTQPKSSPPTLAEALPVVLDALVNCPEPGRLRTAMLALLDDDIPAYRQRIAELLVGNTGNTRAAA